VRLLLVSTYELGHQPVHLALPAAGLSGLGIDVQLLDLSIEPFDVEVLEDVDAVAFSVPMHTAMRLATEVASMVRAERPGLPIAFYGLYAAVGREATVGTVADIVISGEYLPALKT
jgi:B12 binding domain